jgi:hypothetical protein
VSWRGYYDALWGNFRNVFFILPLFLLRGCVFCVWFFLGFWSVSLTATDILHFGTGWEMGGLLNPVAELTLDAAWGMGV